MASADAVDCLRCGHSYQDHQPACVVGAPTPLVCSCVGFRWVDPAAQPDLLGYHRHRR